MGQAGDGAAASCGGAWLVAVSGSRKVFVGLRGNEGKPARMVSVASDDAGEAALHKFIKIAEQTYCTPTSKFSCTGRSVAFLVFLCCFIATCGAFW